MPFASNWKKKKKKQRNSKLRCKQWAESKRNGKSIQKCISLCAPINFIELNILLLLLFRLLCARFWFIPFHLFNFIRFPVRWSDFIRYACGGMRSKNYAKEKWSPKEWERKKERKKKKRIKRRYKCKRECEIELPLIKRCRVFLLRLLRPCTKSFSRAFCHRCECGAQR